MGVLAGISHLTQRNRVLVMDMLMDPGTSNLEASHAAPTANVERIQTLWKDYAAKPPGPRSRPWRRPLPGQCHLSGQGLIPASAALVDKYDDSSRTVHRRSVPTRSRCRTPSSAWWPRRSTWPQSLPGPAP